MAHRALKSWERQRPAGEGVPIPQQAVFLVARQLRSEGRVLEALIAETSMGAYFRIGERAQLRREDLVDDGAPVAFILGVAER
eukprot:7823101-Alexandrium_andersonii.AAC.1